LKEGCELHGLHLRQVMPSYTSRQDSRTGAPGLRCADVSVSEFLEPAGFWNREITSALKRIGDHRQDGNQSRLQYIAEVHTRLQEMTAAQSDQLRFVRVPLRGGEIFVSAKPDSPLAQGIQADLNAAANIGLKALLDPDWPGKWWYVPCEAQTLKPLAKSTKGCALLPGNRALAAGPTQPNPAGKNSVVNLWRDVSATKLTDGTWTPYAPYQADVARRVVALLRGQFEARCVEIEGFGDVPF
jgi:hypothetical protein